MQGRQPGPHGVQVAFDGVYLSVVGQKAERMSQFPARESIGGETLVDQDQSGSQILFRQVGIESLQLRRDEKPFVNDGAGGKGAEEGALAFLFQHSSQNEELSFEFAAVAHGIEGDEKLLYRGHAGSRYGAYRFGLHGNVAPAEDAVTAFFQRRFDQILFIRFFKDHGHSVLAEWRKIGNDLSEERVGKLEKEAGAVAGLRIVARGAAVDEILEDTQT